MRLSIKNLKKIDYFAFLVGILSFTYGLISAYVLKIKTTAMNYLTCLDVLVLSLYIFRSKVNIVFFSFLFLSTLSSVFSLLYAIAVRKIETQELIVASVDLVLSITVIVIVSKFKVKRKISEDWKYTALHYKWQARFLIFDFIFLLVTALLLVSLLSLFWGLKIPNWVIIFLVSTSIIIKILSFILSFFAAITYRELENNHIKALPPAINNI